MNTNEFLALLDKNLVVRANVEREARPGENDLVRTMIQVWCWDGCPTGRLITVGYIWSEPDELRGNSDIFLHTYPRQDHSAIDQIIIQMREWPLLGREPWLENVAAIATKGGNRLISVANPALLSHYGRLHGLLREAINSQQVGTAHAGLLYHRFAGFIRVQNNKWQKVLDA